MRPHLEQRADRRSMSLDVDPFDADPLTPNSVVLTALGRGIQMQVVIVIIILLLLATVGAPTIAQKFFVTGSQYYEACWELRSKIEHFATYAGSRGVVIVEIPKSETPTKTVLWAQCEVIAQRAFFNAGMMFSGNVETSEGHRLRAACPSVARGCLYILALELIERSGGPRYFDRWLPASYLLTRVYEANWPSCDHERRRQGFPRIVERKPGEFGCDPPTCEAHLKAN